MTKTKRLIVLEGRPAERSKLAKQIDLKGLQLKFIGETEKNLARLFAESNHDNAVLFFDEADALLGKRSAVKDSHNRYAELEKLLSGFHGTVILGVSDTSALPASLLEKAQVVRASDHSRPN